MTGLKPWKIALAFLLVFAAGLAVGTVATKFQYKRAFERSLSPEYWVESAMEKLDREVKLTVEQKPKVRQLLEAGAKKVRENVVHMATDSALVIDRVGDQIAKELTPEQRQIHARMREEFRKGMRAALNMEFQGDATHSPASNAPVREKGP